MQKEIQLSDGKLLIQIDYDSHVPFISIKRYYIKNKVLQKVITLSMWDDFEFDAYTKENIDYLNFEFQSSDLLYSHLDTLLGTDKSIVIDDNTLEKLKKFMIIERVENNIIIHFIGNKDSELIKQRFSVFIKNIGQDARSKLQDLKLKIRLIDFFRDCENYLVKSETQFQKIKHV